MEDKTLQALWATVLNDIEKTISHPNFVTLFKNTALLSLEENIATIAAPSITIIDLLNKRFANHIKQVLDKELQKDISLSFVAKTLRQKEKASKPTPLFAIQTPTPVAPVIGHLPRVRPDFTFQNFAVSSSNQLAFVSAGTVAANIGHSYNPFFIYGPVGVGKTHLMHAIANDAYRKQPDKKIIYLTSEEFTNEVVEAIRTNETAKMKRRFRSAFLLLIDDIQFIEGKDRVQEELFHTFNILIDQGSQVCLSSDRPPQEIKKLEKRLSSRFAGGLTVDIEPPDFELRSAILMIKAKKYGHDLPIEVAKYLAEIAQDTRSLEGLLLRVITQSTTSGEPISLMLAEKAFSAVKQERRAQVHVEDVIQCICDFYQIKSTQLKGPKRDASLVKARQITMYLLKTELGLTFAEIGNFLGGRDHTTIMYGVEKIEGLVKNKARVTEDILGITKTLRG